MIAEETKKQYAEAARQRKRQLREDKASAARREKLRNLVSEEMKKTNSEAAKQRGNRGR